MNEFKRLINSTRKELIDVGYQKIDECCTKGLQGIADFQSSASTDEIRTKMKEFSASIKVRYQVFLCEHACHETGDKFKYYLWEQKNAVERH